MFPNRSAMCRRIPPRRCSTTPWGTAELLGDARPSARLCQPAELTRTASLPGTAGICSRALAASWMRAGTPAAWQRRELWQNDRSLRSLNCTSSSSGIAEGNHSWQNKIPGPSAQGARGKAFPGVLAPASRACWGADLAAQTSWSVPCRDRCYRRAGWCWWANRWRAQMVRIYRYRLDRERRPDQAGRIAGAEGHLLLGLRRSVDDRQRDR